MRFSIKWTLPAPTLLVEIGRQVIVVVYKGGVVTITSLQITTLKKERLVMVEKRTFCS